jgi:Pentapeptide repeats (9 copies)
MSFWWWTLAAVALSLITAVGVIIWLLAIASHAEPGTDQANARLDAVRTGLAAGAGAAAAVGLGLAFRRQHHQEIATVLTDLDATERRITELYTKAVEQLGSDKAPVRLGGLYALERLAQDNREHRQTIVSVICAYLRMPFSLRAPTGAPGNAWVQERQVRLTAQRILAEHLRDDRAEDKRSTDPVSPHFWPDIRLDLTGATLIDFSLLKGVTAEAHFSGAAFIGKARFTGATLGALLDKTTSDYFMFDETTVGGASFDGATFGGDASFDGATFGGDASFDGAIFGGDANFKATFISYADFTEAAFIGEAAFNGATVGGKAYFDEATFNGAVLLDETTFGSGEGSLSLEGSHVLSPRPLQAWPPGWVVGPDSSGGYTVVRANDHRKAEDESGRQDVPGRGSA